LPEFLIMMPFIVLCDCNFISISLYGLKEHILNP
jgi:hypothetical protein